MLPHSLVSRIPKTLKLILVLTAIIVLHFNNSNALAQQPHQTPTIESPKITSPTAVPIQTNSSYFKDVVYPALDLAIKILAGIFIAYYLSRRGSKDKIKENLVNAYIDFLDTLTNLFTEKTSDCMVAFWRKFKDEAQEHISDKELLKEFNLAIDEKTTEAKGTKDEKWLNKDTNLSIFTYKFCFLLGKNYYFRRIMPLEKKMGEFLINGDYPIQVAAEVINDPSIKEFFNSDINAKFKNDIRKLQKEAISLALDEMREKAAIIVGTRISKDMLIYVNPYSVQIAESIDKY